MLPSGSWVHIAFGFALGIIGTLFITGIAKSQRKDNAVQKIITALIVFTFSVALVAYVYASAVFGGLLVEWHPLGSPAVDDRVIKVLEIGYVETQSGNIYRFSCLECQEGTWEQVSKVTRDVFFFPSSGKCGTLSFLPKLQPEFIDSKSACISDDLWSTAKVAYAIDVRGQVYSWRHSFSSGDVGPRWDPEKVFFAIAGVTSCLVGTIIVLLGTFYSFMIKRTQKQSSI